MPLYLAKGAPLVLILHSSYTCNVRVRGAPSALIWPLKVRVR